MTVEQFYDMIMMNQYHNVRIKSNITDKMIAEFNDVNGLMKSGCSRETIKAFATDWKNKVYILWV